MSCAPLIFNSVPDKLMYKIIIKIFFAQQSVYLSVNADICWLSEINSHMLSGSITDILSGMHASCFLFFL